MRKALMDLVEKVLAAFFRWHDKKMESIGVCLKCGQIPCRCQKQ